MAQSDGFIRVKPVINSPVKNLHSGPTFAELLRASSEYDAGVRDVLRTVLPEIRGDDKIIYPRDRDIDIFIRSLASFGYEITTIELDDE